MIDFKNKLYVGAEGRSSVFDCTISSDDRAVVVFVHGYKGFKDWGAWNSMGEVLRSNGIGFVSMNLSHNGGTPENPIDFPDLDAFGKNCYSYELQDIDIIITEVKRLIEVELEANIPIVLMGHSRGGGVAVLAASKDSRISKLITLAAISDIGMRFPDGEELRLWKQEGVRYILNGRTKQQLPHYYSFYEDFAKNQEELDIEAACEKINIPTLLIHGDMDQAVSISEGLALSQWLECPLKIIKGTEHTFGIQHPWNSPELSQEMKEVCDEIIRFINK